MKIPLPAACVEGQVVYYYYFIIIIIFKICLSKALRELDHSEESASTKRRQRGSLHSVYENLCKTLCGD